MEGDQCLFIIILGTGIGKKIPEEEKKVGPKREKGHHFSEYS